MGLQLLDNVIQPPGRLVVSRRWDAAEGVLPSWLTVGSADPTDAGVTSAFTAMTAGVPGLVITGAAQAGTTTADRRRASLIGPAVDLSKAAGWRLRIVATGGSSATVIAKVGFNNNHVGSNTQGVTLQQSGDPTTDFASMYPVNSASQKKTRLRWRAGGTRHDLTVWGTVDRTIYLGAGDQLDWGHKFVTGDLALGSGCKPFISFASNGNAATAAVTVHRFDFDVYYD